MRRGFGFAGFPDMLAVFASEPQREDKRHRRYDDERYGHDPQVSVVITDPDENTRQNEQKKEQFSSSERPDVVRSASWARFHQQDPLYKKILSHESATKKFFIKTLGYCNTDDPFIKML